MLITESKGMEEKLTKQEFLKKVLPSSVINIMKSIKKSVELYFIDRYDYKNYKKALKNDSYEKIEYSLFMFAHIIEKGLSHNEIRFQFGKIFLSDLSEYLKKYNKNGWSKEAEAYKNIIGVLKEYKILHDKNNIESDFLSEIFNAEILHDIENSNSNMGGIEVIKANSKKNINSFSELALNRYSIREFSKENVEISEIEEAIKIAQKSPTGCNRQPTKIHIVTNKSMIKNLLTIQKGFKGYETPNTLLITTVDQEAYPKASDRNMAYIDGGLFTMTLLYALEEKLIGACLLNTSFSSQTDRKIKSLLNMKNTEVFINFIPIGKMNDEIRVCSSQRMDINKIMTIHE